MKAITLWQPWATLVAYGYKQFETRSWATHYRGPLLIHAAKRIPQRGELGALPNPEPIRQALAEIGIRQVGDLPFGCAVAVVEVTAVLRTEVVGPGLDEAQLAFGDYAPGRYAWRLTDVRRLLEPVPLQGRQGLWSVRDEALWPVRDEALQMVLGAAGIK